MARTLRFTDDTALSDFAPDLPVNALGASAPLSDGKIDGLAAGAVLADEPVPDHLIQLALKLAQALDSET